MAAMNNIGALQLGRDDSADVNLVTPRYHRHADLGNVLVISTQRAVIGNGHMKNCDAPVRCSMGSLTNYKARATQKRGRRWVTRSCCEISVPSLGKTSAKNRIIRAWLSTESQRRALN